MHRTRQLCRLGPIVILVLLSGATMGQELAPAVTETNRAEFFAKFAVVDYDAPAPDDPDELAIRTAKNQRYDNQHWVVKNPNPEADFARRSIAVQALTAYPVEESDLVVIGLSIGMTAHLSNDKAGVYSEYTIRVEQILKSGSSKSPITGSTITIDRAGGAVRYPDGHKVAYFIAEKRLPLPGSTYALFLRDDKRSKNYEIVTLYELKRDIVVPLDSGYPFDDIRGMTKTDFLKTLREKASKPADN